MTLSSLNGDMMRNEMKARTVSVSDVQREKAAIKSLAGTIEYLNVRANTLTVFVKKAKKRAQSEILPCRRADYQVYIRGYRDAMREVLAEINRR